MNLGDADWQVHWFGDHGHPPRGFLGGDNETPIPVGAICAHCDEPIRAGQSGMWVVHYDADGSCAHRPMHDECFLRQIVGSIAHQRGECGCPNSCADHRSKDPAERLAEIVLGRPITKREEAIAAVRFSQARGMGKR